VDDKALNLGVRFADGVKIDVVWADSAEAVQHGQFRKQHLRLIDPGGLEGEAQAADGFENRGFPQGAVHE